VDRVLAASARDRDARPRDEALRRTSARGAATLAARRELLAAHHRSVLAALEDLRCNLAAIEAKLTRLEASEQEAKG
jgi:hypothetical protein